VFVLSRPLFPSVLLRLPSSLILDGPLLDRVGISAERKHSAALALLLSLPHSVPGDARPLALIRITLTGATTAASLPVMRHTMFIVPANLGVRGIENFIAFGGSLSAGLVRSPSVGIQLALLFLDAALTVHELVEAHRADVRPYLS
jgi:hypothetical protein